VGGRRCRRGAGTTGRRPPRRWTEQAGRQDGRGARRPGGWCGGSRWRCWLGEGGREGGRRGEWEGRGEKIKKARRERAVVVVVEYSSLVARAGGSLTAGLTTCRGGLARPAPARLGWIGDSSVGGGPPCKSQLLYRSAREGCEATAGARQTVATGQTAARWQHRAHSRACTCTRRIRRRFAPAATTVRAGGQAGRWVCVFVTVQQVRSVTGAMYVYVTTCNHLLL
jgi:hypothetical protein